VVEELSTIVEEGMIATIAEAPEEEDAAVVACRLEMTPDQEEDRQEVIVGKNHAETAIGGMAVAAEEEVAVVAVAELVGDECIAVGTSSRISLHQTLL